MKKKSHGCLSVVVWVLMILLGAIIVGVVIGYAASAVPWKWLLLLILPLLIGAYIITVKDDRKEKKKPAEYLEAGKLIFASYGNEFVDFYQSYLQKKEQEPIEALRDFADDRGLLQVIDWRGEENEGEIEEFIETLLEKKIAWVHTASLRSRLSPDAQRDGKSITGLFKAVDQDMKADDRGLLFFVLGDSYEYIVADTKTVEEIDKMKLSEIRAVGRLR